MQSFVLFLISLVKLLNAPVFKAISRTLKRRPHIFRVATYFITAYCVYSSGQHLGLLLLPSKRRRFKSLQHDRQQDTRSTSTITVTPGLESSKERYRLVTPNQFMDRKMKFLREYDGRKLVDKNAFSMNCDPEDPCIVYCGDVEHANGFLAACVMAWKDHHPLKLRPQDFWLAIVQAFGLHVQNNAEELRSTFVKHDGQKPLDVVLDGTSNEWRNCTKAFCDSIAESMHPEMVSFFDPAKFSGATQDDQVVMGMTLMATFQEYFRYGVHTCCGFPYIILEGSVEDYERLRKDAEELLDMCKPDFADEWKKALLPVLDKILETRRNEVADPRFWNSMIKKGGQTGSGGKTWFTGWINVFFPTMNFWNSKNKYCVPYKEHEWNVDNRSEYKFSGYDRIPEGADGPDVQQFPQGKTIVPVCVHNHSKVEYVKFISGFGPPKQTGRDGVVSVVQFWRVEVAKPPRNRPCVQKTEKLKRQTARRSRYGNANYY